MPEEWSGDANSWRESGTFVRVVGGERVDERKPRAKTAIVIVMIVLQGPEYFGIGIAMAMVLDVASEKALRPSRSEIHVFITGGLMDCNAWRPASGVGSKVFSSRRTSTGPVHQLECGTA